MKPDVERINFVLRFGETDLEQLREGAWYDLREDVLNFVGRPTSRLDELTVESLLAIQKEVREILTPIARANSEGRSPEVSIELLLDKGKMTFHIGSEGIQTQLENTSLTDAFKFTLAHTGLEPSYVRVCLASDCGRLFYADHGAQKYHSPLCAKRENMRLVRARKSGAMAQKKVTRSAGRVTKQGSTQ